jgi:hypothetical protein
VKQAVLKVTAYCKEKERGTTAVRSKSVSCAVRRFDPQLQSPIRRHGEVFMQRTILLSTACVLRRFFDYVIVAEISPTTLPTLSDIVLLTNK